MNRCTLGRRVRNRRRRGLGRACHSSSAGLGSAERARPALCNRRHARVRRQPHRPDAAARRLPVLGFFALLITANGISGSMFAAPNSSSIMSSVPASQRSVASGICSTCWRRAVSSLPAAAQQTITGRQLFPDPISGPFHQGLVVVFVVAADLAGLAGSRLSSARRPLRPSNGRSRGAAARYRANASVVVDRLDAVGWSPAPPTPMTAGASWSTPPGQVGTQPLTSAEFRSVPSPGQMPMISSWALG